jgi:hypothetical protein
MQYLLVILYWHTHLPSPSRHWEVNIVYMLWYYNNREVVMISEQGSDNIQTEYVIKPDLKAFVQLNNY